MTFVGQVRGYMGDNVVVNG